MWKEVLSVSQSPCRVVMSVTHDSQSLHKLMFVCLFSLALIAGTSPQKSISARREQVPFSMAMEMENSCTSVFPNTRAWEQQDRN